MCGCYVVSEWAGSLRTIDLQYHGLWASYWEDSLFQHPQIVGLHLGSKVHVVSLGFQGQILRDHCVGPYKEALVLDGGSDWLELSHSSLSLSDFLWRDELAFLLMHLGKLRQDKSRSRLIRTF